MNWFLGFLVAVISFGAVAAEQLTDAQLDGVTAGKAPPVGKPAVVCCQKTGSVVTGIKKPSRIKL